jgi:hypothetical protein
VVDLEGHTVSGLSLRPLPLLVFRSAFSKGNPKLTPSVLRH